MNIKTSLITFKTIFLSLLFGACFLLNACSNKPINYYLLEMPQVASTQILQNKDTETSDSRPSIPTGVNLSGPTIALAQVIIPQYLDRQQIVTREDNVDFSIDENNRWGEELSAGISRVLCSSLTKHLSQIGATSSALRVGISPDYTINLEIRAFEGMLDGTVRLRALWSLDTSSKRRNNRDRTDRSETNPLWQAFFDKSIEAGTTYTSYVNAYGALVDALAKDISSVFMDLYTKTEKK